VFVFFNNDRGGAAIHNARTLRRMAERRGLQVAAPAEPA
jgi:cob(I)alamin adenosyltransferase